MSNPRIITDKHEFAQILTETTRHSVVKASPRDLERAYNYEADIWGTKPPVKFVSNTFRWSYELELSCTGEVFGKANIYLEPGVKNASITHVHCFEKYRPRKAPHFIIEFRSKYARQDTPPLVVDFCHPPFLEGESRVVLRRRKIFSNQPFEEFEYQVDLPWKTEKEINNDA